MPAVQPIARTGQFLATVPELERCRPGCAGSTCSSPEFADQHWPLACDIAVVLDRPDGREVRRRYTVRAAAGRPADRRRGAARPRTRVDLGQPAAGRRRGDVLRPARRGAGWPTADWLLALTDESGLPAIAALAEAAAAGRLHGLRRDRRRRRALPVRAERQVRWLDRDGRPTPARPTCSTAVAAPQLRPGAGRGYAYVLGESRAVVQVRDAARPARPQPHRRCTPRATGICSPARRR